VEYLHEGVWLGYNYYTPEVVVTFHAADGTPVNIKMEVDSGASISLLPRSAATALGISYETGVPISLGGVGGTTFVAYVHTVTAFIGDEQAQIPIAFAPTDDSESFPPLLGRLGLYDQLSVTMDNTAKAVCVGAITTPTPNPYLGPSGFPVELLLFGAFLLLVAMRVK